MFSDDGQITQIETVGDISSSYPFYYYMRRAVYHTLLIHTGFLVFKETTEGPFRPEDTIYPEWAPSDSEERVVVSAYLDRLNEAIRET